MGYFIIYDIYIYVCMDTTCVSVLRKHVLAKATVRQDTALGYGPSAEARAGYGRRAVCCLPGYGQRGSQACAGYGRHAPSARREVTSCRARAGYSYGRRVVPVSRGYGQRGSEARAGYGRRANACRQKGRESE